MTTIDRQPEVVQGYRKPRTRPDRQQSPRSPITGQTEPTSAWRQRIPGPQLPGFVSGVTVLAGLWLLLAPAMWNYGDTGGGFDARWNDLLVGSLITALGVARLTRLVRLGPATTLAVAAGSWMVIAPFVLAYGLGSGSTPATVNDVLIGLTIVIVTVLGHSSARMSVTTSI